MKKAAIHIHKHRAGTLIAHEENNFEFVYDKDYNGPSISLTMPVRTDPYLFENFPPFFDGLLPEGIQLDGLLRIKKIDKYDYLEQLITTGQDLVGAVTVHRMNSDNE